MTTRENENDKIVEEIKAKFEASMKWGKQNYYDQEDVKTIVLGNINTISYRFKEALDAKDAALRKAVEEINLILDADESRIIRNEKDGYPDGRPDRDLTAAERIKALCKYAADWKRWCLENESKISQAVEEEREAIIKMISEDYLGKDYPECAEDIIRDIRERHSGTGCEMNSCGNSNHPKGAWHELTPFPNSILEAIKQWFRKKKYGCGCKS